MSFLPNTTAQLSRQLGLNVHSEPTFGAPFTVECGIVMLNAEAKQTSVRADSSASRGTAEETVIAAKILFLPKAYPEIGDKVELHGMALRCNAIQPRVAVSGVLDHFECQFEVWT